MHWRTPSRNCGGLAGYEMGRPAEQGLDAPGGAKAGTGYGALATSRRLGHLRTAPGAAVASFAYPDTRPGMPYDHQTLRTTEAPHPVVSARYGASLYIPYLIPPYGKGG